jgi:hypothetical protein
MEYSPKHIALAVLLIIVILVNMNMTYKTSTMVGSIYGIVIIVCFVLYLFTEGPVLGILGLIAGYALLKQTDLFMPKYASPSSLLPTENRHEMLLSPVNQFPPTLEEMMVNNLSPIVYNDEVYEHAFKPNLNNNHSATTVV